MMVGIGDGMPRKPKPLEARIKALSVIDQITGCWEWQGTKNSEGYGRITVFRKNRRAHRIAYEAFVGPIPDGLSLDHLCRNTSCVNPAHLEPLPIKENILRGNGPPAINARKTHCKKGHLLSEDNIYVN